MTWADDPSRSKLVSAVEWRDNDLHRSMQNIPDGLLDIKHAADQGYTRELSISALGRSEGPTAWEPHVNLVVKLNGGDYMSGGINLSVAEVREIWALLDQFLTANGDLSE